jgi:hypothetical protein
MTCECREVYAGLVGAVSWERGYQRNWPKWAIFLRLLESGKLAPGPVNEDVVDHAWTCNCCGRSFNTLPMDYAFSAP